MDVQHELAISNLWALVLYWKSRVTVGNSSLLIVSIEYGEFPCTNIFPTLILDALIVLANKSTFCFIMSATKCVLSFIIKSLNYGAYFYMCVYVYAT